jgi:DNA-binding XRE family transcriptional regulator
MPAGSGSTVVMLSLAGRTGPQPLWRQVAGDVVRERRRTLGLRLRDVADRAGISPQYLSEVERGRKEPSSEMLSSICGALGLPLLDLLRAAGRRLNGGDGFARPAVPSALPAPNGGDGFARPTVPSALPAPNGGEGFARPTVPAALPAPTTGAPAGFARPTMAIRPTAPSLLAGPAPALLRAA